jgi:putative endonuclease
MPLSRSAPARRGDATWQSACRRGTGRRGEDLAAEHLRRLGYRILARNARTGEGEIDLVASDGATIAFVEVKTSRLQRGRSRAGPSTPPLERLGHGQRARLRRLALAWLCEHRGERPAPPAIRFDAIGVLLDEQGALLTLEHLEGAW